MAKKINGPQIIIANRLLDGRVVFLTKDSGWSNVAEDAVVAVEETRVVDLVTRAAKSEAANEVISATAIEAELSGGGAYPAHIKFAMQARGPSVRPDLGYQVSPRWEAPDYEG